MQKQNRARKYVLFRLLMMLVDKSVCKELLDDLDIADIGQSFCLAAECLPCMVKHEGNNTDLCKIADQRNQPADERNPAQQQSEDGGSEGNGDIGDQTDQTLIGAEAAERGLAVENERQEEDQIAQSGRDAVLFVVGGVEIAACHAKNFLSYFSSKMIFLFECAQIIAYIWLSFNEVNIRI